MARIGNKLQYEPSPNGGNYSFVAFDILAETTGTGQHSPAVETPAPTSPSPIESGTDVTNRRNQVDAAKRQGDNYYENGKYDEAISAYQGGLKLDPSNAQLLQALQRAQTAKAAEEKFNQ
jgi:tetratricopeptide (TPR) repeat protein